MPRISIDDTTPEALQVRIDDLIWENFELRGALRRVARIYEEHPQMHTSIVVSAMYEIARKALD